ncbi:MAG: class B sortase [Oscillospiraceae bacterium]|nr:class B sortase [Oscillospiraceae bacterium]
MKSTWRVIRQLILVVLCGIFLGVFIFAAYQLYQTFHGYSTAKKQYENLNQQFVSAETTEPSAEPAATPASDRPMTDDPTPAVVSGPITVDFASLQAQNQQVVGWIYSPDTVISYPVLRGTDNEYYLHHFIDGSENASGSIFMDYLCEDDLSSTNTLIYGHHMNNGSMFAGLVNYKNEGYLAAHPTLYYYTPSQVYRMDVFACFVTDGNSDVYTINFNSTGDYQYFLDQMRSRSDFDAGVDVTVYDRIMTLSTCSYEYNDARYVVLCKIAPMQ